MANSDKSPLLIFTKLLVLIPYGLVAAILGGLAWVVSFLPLRLVSAHRDIVISCLASFPDKPYPEIRRLARRSLIETALTLIRFPYLWQQDPAKSLKAIHKVHGREAVEKAIKSEKPVLLLSLHQSCWEYQALEAGRLCEALILYKPGSPLDPLAIKGRESTGCKTVPATGKGIFASMNELKKGGALIFLVDHPPQNSNNPCVRFFGHEVLVPGLIYKLVEEFCPTIFYISTRRVGRNAFDIYYEPAEELMACKEQNRFLSQLMRDIQGIILKAPEQYNWAYNRFRWGPDGRRYWYKRRNALAIIAGAAKGEDIPGLLRKYEEKL